MQLLPGIAIVVFWEFASGPLLDDFFLSKPTLIVSRLLELNKWGGVRHATTTLQEMFYGYVIGAVLGIVLGYYLGFSTKVSRFVEPYIFAFYAVPRIALAPLLIIWLGIGIYSKIFMAAIMVFFMVFYNTHLAARSINRELLDLGRLMGATESQLARRVVLPFMSPFIFVGLRTAIPRAAIGAIGGEFIASRAGLGFFASRASALYDAPGVFAAVTILVVATLLAGFLVGMVEKRVLRWQRVT